MATLIESPNIAEIVIPRPMSGPLTYLIPDELLNSVTVGAVVEVPFRSNKIHGFVLKIKKQNPEEKLNYELKKINSVLSDGSILHEKDIQFYQWISDYYQVTLGEVFFSAFPTTLFNKPKKPKKEKSEPVIATLEEKDLLTLTAEQSSALKTLSDSISASKNRSFLLHGVTGSGKTEVYIRAAKEALKQNRSAAIMVPEIALTPQLRSRFEEHFGNQVAVLHSSLGEGKRRNYWNDILAGKKKIVVGARSAIFAPLKDIGLIVVDEEHESSYKQEGHLRYHARDLALVRGKLHGATVVLGSATPSIESYYGALHGKHELIQLTKRPAERPLPVVEIVDLKEAPKKSAIFSENLILKLQETLDRKEQAIIFLNRKGFSNFILCKSCGEVPACNHCSVTLTYYKSQKLLKCHYCGSQSSAPSECGKCFSTEFKHFGFGTESIEEELQSYFPNQKVGRLDAETASTPKKLETILDDFRNGKIDVLIGTQMLAKGHDFPNVTFIGVVLAELSLHLPDFRAPERTYQLLSQVAGRAGRGNKPGTVLIQTFIPEHYVIECAVSHSYEKFYAKELPFRKEFLYPPFSRMAQIEFRNKNESKVMEEAEKTARILESLNKENSVEILGPTPAAISKIANEYRWHLLLKSEKITHLNSFLKTLRKYGARLIDVDPVNTL